MVGAHLDLHSLTPGGQGVFGTMANACWAWDSCDVNHYRGHRDLVARLPINRVRSTVRHAVSASYSCLLTVSIFVCLRVNLILNKKNHFIKKHLIQLIHGNHLKVALKS